MLADLMSRWIIGIEAEKCKYEKGPAVSVAILNQVSHVIEHSFLMGLGDQEGCCCLQTHKTNIGILVSS